MNAPLPIGLAAGVCAALLFAAGASGAFVTKLLLFMLAPLPLFLAGLGWGPLAVTVAGAAGVATAALIQGVGPALTFLAAIALPVPLLCWLAHLRRPVAVASSAAPGSEAASAAAQTRLEWYPPGRLLAWIAVIAGVLSMLSVLTIGTSVEAITKVMRTLVDQVVKAWASAGGKPPNAEEAENLTHAFVRFMPVATAVSVLFMLVINFWLAGRILRMSGRLFRDWPVLAALSLPPLLALGLVAALVVAAGSSVIAVIAGGFAGAIMAAYACLGLAVIHWVTYGKAARPMTLTFAYITCFVLAPYGTLPIALLGLLESVLRLRSRAGGAPPPPPGPSPTAAA